MASFVWLERGSPDVSPHEKTSKRLRQSMGSSLALPSAHYDEDNVHDWMVGLRIMVWNDQGDHCGEPEVRQLRLAVVKERGSVIKMVLQEGQNLLPMILIVDDVSVVNEVWSQV